MRGVPAEIAHCGDELKDPVDAAGEGGGVRIEVFCGNWLPGEDMSALDVYGHAEECRAGAGKDE